jgi:hypothetical protein
VANGNDDEQDVILDGVVDPVVADPDAQSRSTEREAEGMSWPRPFSARLR